MAPIQFIKFPFQLFFDYPFHQPRAYFSRTVSRWTIAQKIAVGYITSLGIAVTGTTLGLAIANQYQQRALDLEKDARTEIELTTWLQNQVLEVRIHQQQLIFELEDAEKFEATRQALLTEMGLLQQTWQEFLVLEGGTTDGDNQSDHEEEVALVAEFIQTHQSILARYLQQVEQLLNQPDALSLQDNSRDAVQRRLTQFNQQPVNVEVDDLSHDLHHLIERSYQELAETDRHIATIQTLRLQIIVGSMALSVLLSVLLLAWINRAITNSLKTITEMAHTVTSESRFDIQIPIKGRDEIGGLANSLNQLIRKVNQLLAEHAQAQAQLTQHKANLKQRVQERTQELSQKNIQLHYMLGKLRRTQAQMLQSEKMSALGQLVAGIAHEINNPVNFIHGNLSYVDSYTEELVNLLQRYQTCCPSLPKELQTALDAADVDFLMHDMAKILQSMRVGTDRIREIVVSLRNFSRLDEAEFKAVDIHEGLDNTLVILHHRFKAKTERPDIQVIKDYGQLPLVKCYAGQLNQVFMSILNNAIDAFEDLNRGRSFKDIVANPNVIQIRTSMLDQHRVAIAISDNGPGMSEAIQTRLFDPFFTTKAVGQGTGLGLSVSYQIVTQKHGGQLWCDSTPGQGTTIVIEIPVQQKT